MNTKLFRLWPVLLLALFCTLPAGAQQAKKKTVKKTVVRKAKPKDVKVKSEVATAAPVAGVLDETTPPASRALDMHREEKARTQAVEAPQERPDDAAPGDAVFTKVEIEASFPGGHDSLGRYLRQNLKFPGDAPGGVYVIRVQFLVDVDGSLSEVKALNDPGFGFGREAVRVIKEGPKWIPAQQNGRIMKAYRTQPISFVVSK